MYVPYSKKEKNSVADIYNNLDIIGVDDVHTKAIIVQKYTTV